MEVNATMSLDLTNLMTPLIVLPLVGVVLLATAILVDRIRRRSHSQAA
jgi:hypothetical protein